MTSQFGALVRLLRQRAELTQEDLAERAGLGVRTIRGLETGERADPRVATVRRLADAFALDEADRVELFAAAGFARTPVEAAPVLDPPPRSPAPPSTAGSPTPPTNWPTPCGRGGSGRRSSGRSTTPSRCPCGGCRWPTS
ncbi:helix-turn-helix transcriptional regulator [Actinokineospora soli]|uniref:Helix-turn-helix transcriptional regulator n=1 Tax=Actinokineospora soli TaxID=1048753 RepID=A0ABW2TNZ8_9PSEU